MLDYNVINTWLGFGTALIALIALYIEGRRQRLALQTQLLLNLNEQMTSRENKALRKKAAKSLLSTKSPNYELGEVLDFFSVICYLYKAKALDADLLYKQFGWWIVRYWLCSRDWLDDVRKKVDPESWMTLEMVAKEFAAKEQKEGARFPSKEMLKHFLKVETGLYLETL